MLRRGGLVAFPTETVYGLGADAQRSDAVARIFEVKGRPAEHPLIVHVPAGADLQQWAARVPDGARRLAEKFWPGPLTLILDRGPRVPLAVTGGQDSVALRVPDHPIALALLSAFGDGIAAPSANRFGRISPTRAVHVQRELGSLVDLILDGGPCRVGIESTIVSFVGEAPQLLRPGTITAAAIAEVLGAELRPPSRESERSPGQLEQHYAPETALEVVPAALLVERALTLRRAGSSIAVLAKKPIPAPLRPILREGEKPVTWVIAPSSPEHYARALYATLRALDQRGVDRILVEELPGELDWAAAADRLRRAASKS